jgi:ribonuclease P/MRP protein subunit RPP1
MKYYDYCVKPESDLKNLVEMAKKLGWYGLVIISDKEIKKNKFGLEGIDVALGVEIKPKNAFELKQKLRKLRRKREIIIVQGGDIEINRMIVKMPEVDILSKPFGDENSGLDHVICKLAKENNVAIEFCIGDIIHSYKTSRVDIFSKMVRDAKLVRKYKAPFVITSRAVSEWDLRSPSEFISFGRLLGFQMNEVKDAISDKILKENRKRLSPNWIIPGVEIEK